MTGTTVIHGRDGHAVLASLVSTTRSEIVRQLLRNRSVPLVAPDPDVVLDLQAALAQVYEGAS